jgi:hypothetical protein
MWILKLLLLAMCDIENAIYNLQNVLPSHIDVSLSRRFTHRKPLYAIKNPLDKQVSNSDITKSRLPRFSRFFIAFGDMIQ